MTISTHSCNVMTEDGHKLRAGSTHHDFAPRHAGTPPRSQDSPSACTAPATARRTTPVQLPKMPQELLIDVRSPVEFSTGPLVSDLAPTINIEYTQIDSLADIYAQQHITVHKEDHITLYCRSGRRSDIAKRRLEELGYRNVRDIGGFEDARRVLDRETVARQLDGLVGEEDDESGNTAGKENRADGRDGARKKSLSALLKGLEECDA